MPYSFTVGNPATYTDEEIAEGVAFGNVLQAEALPDDPPTPVDVAIASHREVPERIRRKSVRVRAEDGTIVASAGIRIDPEHDDNPDILWCGPTVVAEHRRNGIGTQLLAHLVAMANKENRTRFIGSTNDRMVGGPEFAGALGAEVKQRMHLNHLPMAEVDRPMLERWVAEGPGRAPGYEVFGWDGPVPEEHMETFLDTVLVMNTAPRDDLQINDFTMTADQVREGEKQFAAVKGESWVLVARHIESGEWAGFHDVSWAPSDPNVVWVGATGVRPEHRGHALGKWLKAAMTLRVMDERPEVVDIRTGNADSNDAMLGINKQMGYRPFIATTTWEIPVEKVAAWLAERGVEIPSI